jgi:hypothetical protein
MYVRGELLKANLEVLSSDPTPASMGLIYYNSSTTFAKVYNGTTWKSLVDASTAQTISNKVLDNTTTATIKDNAFTLQDNGDVTKQAVFELSGITTSTIRTYTLPDASVTLLGVANTVTVQNKTLDNSNSVTVKDANLVIQDDGDTTKQFKIQASGISTATTRTMTVPDSDFTAVGTSIAQVITSKDIDGGTASNTSRFTIPKNTATNLTALTRKQGTFVYDTTNNVPLFDDGTNLNTVATNAVATASIAGIVSTVQQSFGGLKKFEGGAANVANIRASESTDKTLTDTDQRYQIFTITAGIAVTLPTTSIKAGEEWYLENPSAFDMQVKASNGTVISASNAGTGSVGDPTVKRGYVYLRALQNTPTTPAHWLVTQVFEYITTATTFTFNGSGGTSSSVSLQINRINNKVSILIPSFTATSGTSSTTFTSNTAIDTRLRPTNTPMVLVDNRESGAVASPFVSAIRLESDGTFTLKKVTGAAWTNGAASCGWGSIGAAATLTYYIE